MQLFLKVGRLGNPRTIAWDASLIGIRSLGRQAFYMTAAEYSEFEFLTSHGKHSSIGAGGQYEYRVYDRLARVQYPYAIVRPDSLVVREQYPNACRVVNVSTGRESALQDTLEHAQETAGYALAGRLKGSFS